MATCEDCIYKPICDAYADFGVTDVPKSDLTPCELFKDKSRFVEVVRCKDCSNDLFFRRYQGAREVIDLIAKQVGIDPDNTSFWLYAPDTDGTTPILKRIEEWFSRNGEKAQLKRRLQELERENSLLRSLIQK